MLNRGKLTPLALLLAGNALVAQETMGSATGRITTRSGQPVAGASVRLTSPNLLGERNVLANESGTYRVQLLPSGEYTFTISAKGYLTVKGRFHVLAGQASRQDVLLPEEKVQSAVVEVMAQAAQVDKTDTVTQSNFSADTVDQIVNRSYQSIVSLTPGITGTLDPNVGGYDDDAIKIRGGLGHNTKVLVNGVTVTEEGGGYLNETVSIMDMVESLAVIQSPLNARYGNTDGGLISMVTTKGTNEFTGTLRLKYSKNDWSASDIPYPRRDGSPSQDYPGTDDSPNRVYDITVRGPIWKDHITFAYGSEVTPEFYPANPYPVLASAPPVSTDTTGTYYRDPLNGTVIRDTNLFAAGQPGNFDIKNTYNQFVLFSQLGPDHTLEWNYQQNSQKYVYQYGRLDPGAYGGDNYSNHVWSLAYKGIIGSQGLLEVRFAHTYREWTHPTSSTPPIWLTYMPTNVPDAGGNYPNNSLLQGYDAGAQAFNINGFNASQGDSTANDSFTINYEHTHTAGSSQHLIDVGIERQAFKWNIQTPNALDVYFAPGLIGPNAPAQYANQFLVFNTTTATLGDLDPASPYASMPMLGSAYDVTTIPGQDDHQPGGLGLMPRHVHQWGDSNGNIQSITTSYYLNDLWTLNSHHSLMLGVRLDDNHVFDTVYTMSHYTIATPRFEYKWDIKGDQTRIFNVSMGQFSAREAASLFLPASHGRYGNTTVTYWNQGSASPYLVSLQDLLNPANYGYTKSVTYAGDTFKVDPSWKAPVSTEYTVGFRRAYTSGGYWRTTLVYKDWKNLFDWFPGDVAKDPSGNPNLLRVLRNDALARRTYKSLELEWMLPLTQRVQLGGNYTYARLMSNVRSNIDSPIRTTDQPVNWRDYTNLYVPYSVIQPNSLRDSEHNLKMFLLTDLTTGKVKSSVSVLFTYASGRPDTYSNLVSSSQYSAFTFNSRNITYQIPFPTVPGYYEPNNPSYQNTGGLPNTISIPVDGLRMTNVDQWSLSLKYSLEMPLWRTLVWFMGIQVNNPFNVRTWGEYSLSSTSNADNWGSPASNAYGWRAQSDVSQVGTLRSTYPMNLPRSFALETGIKF